MIEYKNIINFKNGLRLGHTKYHLLLNTVVSSDVYVHGTNSLFSTYDFLKCGAENFCCVQLYVSFSFMYFLINH